MATNVRFDGPSAAERLTPEVLDRLPPQSLEAEKGVIGSIILDPLLCDEIVPIVQPEDFYSDAHEALFRHIIEINNAGRRVDNTLLIERLKQQGDYERIGGAAYLAEIYQDVPLASNGVHYAQIVREKAIIRRLITVGREIIVEAHNTAVEPREMLNLAEAKIFNIRDERDGGQLTSFHDLVLEVWERLDARMSKDQGQNVVPTGFADLDKCFSGGFREGELIILAARPSMGKTALATNIAEHVTVRYKIPTMFVSLEMSRLELGERMLSAFAKVDSSKMRDLVLSQADQGKLRDKGDEYSAAPLFIDDTPSRSLLEIAASARRLKRKEGLGLIIIDYLQLIEPDNTKDSRQEQVARMARRLKAMAREIKVPVLCLAQLNRQAEATRDNIPRLSHLRESGAIEQDADVVMFVHREEYYLTQEERDARPDVIGQAKVIIAKHRNGPTGEIDLHWFANYTRFESTTKDHDEPFDGY